ncbi:NADPH-dependent FMN reductase [Rosenbergiella epipactidis]|uniref:NADPH-dependent FMN reductase n=1 Tax=Rosenbergiella epipactidis TaxID=1544694 RepID=UPI0034DE1B49
MKIQIIIGSVRLGRIGPELEKWIKNALEENAVQAESEIIDLKERPLPMDDEPGLPVLGHYDQPHTRA